MNKILENKSFHRRNVVKGGFQQFYTHPIEELPMWLVGRNKSYGLWLNPIKNGIFTHSIDSFDIPYIVWFDIDFHSDEAESDFNEDYDSCETLLNELKGDSNIFFCGYSQGGGIRFGMIVSSIYLNSDEKRVGDIHKKNSQVATEYIENNYKLRSSANYFDKCKDRLSQPTFPLRESGFYINFDCTNLYHEKLLDIEKIYDTTIVFDNDSSFIKMAKNVTTNEKLSTIKPLFTSYVPDVISAAKGMNTENRKIIFNLYRKLYEGKSMLEHLRSFDIFNRFINKSNFKYVVSWDVVLKKNKIII